MPAESISQFPSEPIIVTGVVHPHGANGVKGDQTHEWTLQFALEPWQSGEGTLNPGKLTIRRQVTESELGDYMDRIQPYEVRSARVIFTAPTSAELLELLENPASEDDQPVDN